MCAITHPAALPLLKATVLFKYKISVRKREVRYLPLDLADPAAKKKRHRSCQKMLITDPKSPCTPICCSQGACARAGYCTGDTTVKDNMVKCCWVKEMEILPAEWCGCMCTCVISVLPSWEPDAPCGRSRAQSDSWLFKVRDPLRGTWGGTSTYHLPTAAFVSLGPL